MGNFLQKLGSLPKPDQDMPGYTHLVDVSKLLFFGNRRSPACGYFDHVVSTCVPMNRRGMPAPDLTTCNVYFEEGVVNNADDGVERATQCILSAVKEVSMSIHSHKRTLVHCDDGLSRSCVICCAYAVLCEGWAAADAVDYAQERNRMDRCCADQFVMHNKAFIDIVRDLEKHRCKVLADCLSASASPNCTLLQLVRQECQTKQLLALIWKHWHRPRGYMDVPGYTSLPHISPFLCFGNLCSPAFGSFDEVVSTCTPTNQRGLPEPKLTTVDIPFHDGEGRETVEGIKRATDWILYAVGVVAKRISAGRRTLVQCDYGQNRSGAICCAYAVLCARWPADEAVAYVRERNCMDRRYMNQHAMGDERFVEIVKDLAKHRDRICADVCKGAVFDVTEQIILKLVWRRCQDQQLLRDVLQHWVKPQGCKDWPGYVPIPDISPLLFFGNVRSPAHGHFEEVISTCVPTDLTGNHAPELTTFRAYFGDREGSETANDVAIVTRCILRAISVVARALRAGQRTLVHCEKGENCSAAICCAYAVLCVRWTTKDAVSYIRERSLADRRYSLQRTLHNKNFIAVVDELEHHRDCICAEACTDVLSEEVLLRMLLQRCEDKQILPLVFEHWRRVDGREDMPGYAHLPEISPLLFFGNMRSPACGDFDEVVSMCVPADQRGSPAAWLSTVVIFPDHFNGDGAAEYEEFILQYILLAVEAVTKAIRAGKRTLVHCECGQDRSGVICCAYAVLCMQWSGNNAVKYVRDRNHADRRYLKQFSQANFKFKDLMKVLEKRRSKTYTSFGSGMVSEFVIPKLVRQLGHDQQVLISVWSHWRRPEGYEEMPGFAHLPDISPLLFFGNMRSPACGNFDEVISTCMPADRRGEPAPMLTTFNIPFDDGEGRETDEGVEIATQCIMHAVTVVAEAISAGRRTLVHCEYGQNRSGVICCAYAVLCMGWTAKNAVKYIRERNCADRRYTDQCPMHNRKFIEIVNVLQKYCEKVSTGVNTVVSTQAFLKLVWQRHKDEKLLIIALECWRRPSGTPC